jgi:hypothetical protein
MWVASMLCCFVLYRPGMGCLQVISGCWSGDFGIPCQLQVLHCSVPLAELPFAMNGAVVGLGVGPQQQLPSFHNTLNVPADAAPLPCLGLGIVRSLDIEVGVVYLLTPLSDIELQHVDVLQVRAAGVLLRQEAVPAMTCS